VIAKEVNRTFELTDNSSPRQSFPRVVAAAALPPLRRRSHKFNVQMNFSMFTVLIPQRKPLRGG
jgi:hypothetical protein